VCSGERWSAGLKGQPARHAENWRGESGMLDEAGNRRQRQHQRPRYERMACQIDAGANRAIIILVAAVALLLSEERLQGMRSCGGRHAGRIAPCNSFEMNVPKRNGELNRKREQRKPSPEASVITKPTHKTAGVRGTRPVPRGIKRQERRPMLARAQPQTLATSSAIRRPLDKQTPRIRSL
jgi:hypothetical protein